MDLITAPFTGMDLGLSLTTVMVRQLPSRLGLNQSRGYASQTSQSPQHGHPSGLAVDMLILQYTDLI